MSMSWSEHVKQAEMLLREAAENPNTIPEERLVWVTAALAHAQLADAKRVVK
jgi:hypothetical protein